jgi:hypothetical protein
MKNNTDDNITVYWAPSNFLLEEESWMIPYRDPEPLRDLITPKKNNKNIENNNMSSCPAIKDVLKNVYVIKSNLTDAHTLPIEYLNDVSYISPTISGEIIPTDGIITLRRNRKSSVEGYSILSYNLSWTFFADKPVTAKFTAPYFPSASPALGSLLPPGRFDIGQWYRPYNLEYLLPLNTKIFKVEENDPLFYIHLETDKKINFKRYVMTKKLTNLSKEFSFSPQIYGAFKSLSERYRIAKQANIKEYILTEIKKNLIEE